MLSAEVVEENEREERLSSWCVVGVREEEEPRKKGRGVISRNARKLVGEGNDDSP